MDSWKVYWNIREKIVAWVGLIVEKAFVSAEVNKITVTRNELGFNQADVKISLISREFS